MGFKCKIFTVMSSFMSSLSSAEERETTGLDSFLIKEPDIWIYPSVKVLKSK